MEKMVPIWVRMVAEVVDKEDPMHDMSAYDWEPEAPNLMYVWDRSAFILQHQNTDNTQKNVYTMSGLWPGPNTHIVVRNATIQEVCLALKAAYMINQADIGV